MLLERFIETRAATERLCRPLNIEDYIPQAVEFASPPKWHMAHVTWFFEEMVLSKYVKGYEIFDAAFGFLFNSYYRGIGPRAVRTQRGLITRPTVAEVYEYRKYVDVHMQTLLSTQLPSELQDLIMLGINHEQQHQELLLTDLKYVLALNPSYPVYTADSNLVTDRNTNTDWLAVPEGVYEIGHSGTGFHFDNELGRHKVYLHAFEISRALVTNGEYLEFISTGGYQDFQYWLDDGWSWLNENQITKPLYWTVENGNWYQYTLAGLRALDLDAQVAHISYYEAAAYASWRGYRLPTEFEWETSAAKLKWGSRWEWTSSAYQPYPNFTISKGAVGEYNGKFMVNQMVLRGASVATAEQHSRQTYRNFFQPHMQWQYSGIRLAK